MNKYYYIMVIFSIALAIMSYTAGVNDGKYKGMEIICGDNEIVQYKGEIICMEGEENDYIEAQFFFTELN